MIIRFEFLRKCTDRKIMVIRKQITHPTFLKDYQTKMLNINGSVTVKSDVKKLNNNKYIASTVYIDTSVFSRSSNPVIYDVVCPIITKLQRKQKLDKLDNI